MKAHASNTPNGIAFFQSYGEDFVQSARQHRTLPHDYLWIRTGPLHRSMSAVTYILCLLFGAIYLKAALRAQVRNRKVLKQAGRKGCVIYCNHTQPLGDPFVAGILAMPRRTYAVASAANLGIPVLGRILPTAGALPLPDNLGGMRRFLDAVRQRLEEGSAVVVFPEAHVWPWCTFVRPMPASAFAFAADNDVPAFSVTTTYQPRTLRSKPRATFYVDGPFFADASLPRAQRRQDLGRRVHDTMVARSAESTCTYVRYRPAPGAKIEMPPKATVATEDGALAVMYCGDRGTEHGVLMSALSLARHTDRALDIYLLTMGFKGTDRTYEPIDDVYAGKLLEALHQQGRTHDRVTLTDLTDAFAAEPPTSNLASRFTPCCMLRLYADLVDNLPPRILYLDYDVVAHGDLEPLLDVDLAGCELAGTLDHYGRWFFRRRLRELDYVNSGVLFMNLERMGETGLLAACRKLCADKRMFMPDQSALNALASSKRLLPRAFNEQRRLQGATVLQHFSTHFRLAPYPQAVTVKPWEIEKVHRVLGLHAYDDLFETYRDTLNHLAL